MKTDSGSRYYALRQKGFSDEKAREMIEGKMGQEKKQIQYAGTKPVGNLLIDIKVRINAKVEERMYEDRVTLKAVPTSEYGNWELKYDREAIEAQIKSQVKWHLERVLDGKGIRVDLKVGGNALIGFPSDLSARKF